MLIPVINLLSLTVDFISWFFIEKASIFTPNQNLKTKYSQQYINCYLYIGIFSYKYQNFKSGFITNTPNYGAIGQNKKLGSTANTSKLNKTVNEKQSFSTILES